MNKEQKERYIISETIRQTERWSIDMWFDFRNVFIPNYYEISINKSIEFKEWKLKQIKQYNRLLEQL